MTLGDMVALRSLIRIRQHAGDLSAAELLVLNATGHHVPTVLNLSKLRSCRWAGLDEIVIAVGSLWHKAII